LFYLEDDKLEVFLQDYLNMIVEKMEKTNDWK
jgi:hypothetical protein